MFSVGPGAEVFAPTAGERGFLHCRVNNLSTPLPINALTSLTDLIEDEKNAPVIPLLAEVSNVFITLKDSTPPTYPGIKLYLFPLFYLYIIFFIFFI